MAYLFDIVGNKAKPVVEALLIYPFKDIWSRDSSSGKSMAIKEFTFIEFMGSIKPTNPYLGYSEDERRVMLCKDIFNGQRKDIMLRKDKVVEDGVEFIKDLQHNGSPTYRYYVANLEGANKLRKFFLEFDMNEKTDKGVPVYKPADITRALNDADKILNNLSSMKTRVEKEIFDMVKARANKTINYFEK